MYIGQDICSGGVRLVLMVSYCGPGKPIRDCCGANILVSLFESFRDLSISDLTKRYGTLWRKMHKTIHNIINVRVAAAYVPYQDLENKQMLLAFLDEPTEYVGHLRRYTSSLTTQMTYGFRCPKNDDPHILHFFKVCSFVFGVRPKLNLDTGI